MTETEFPEWLPAVSEVGARHTETETDLLVRLERAVVMTVTENVDDHEVATPLIVELVASMEREFRRAAV